MIQFKKATKAKAKLRLALVGPSGSGKTYTGLSIAQGLGKRIALVDTERGSASKYADRFEFDAVDLETFEPAKYVEAIDAAGRGGYDVIVIDSLSHAWMGRGGALEQVDRIAARSNSKSTFNAWREVTPQHNALVDAIVRAPLHVIVTMRTKTEYVLEKDDRGKTAPRKVGLQPVQRDGLEYEFDVVCDLNEANDLIVGKTRCPELQGQVFRRAGQDVAAVLTTWLGSGAEPTTPLVKQLQASVETNWEQWALERTAMMANATNLGALHEAWTQVFEDAKTAKPPKHIFESLQLAKDKLKKALQDAAA